MVSDRKNLAPYVKGLGVGLCEATQGDLQVIQSPLFAHRRSSTSNRSSTSHLCRNTPNTGNPMGI